MKTYTVMAAITGTAWVSVEAEDEEHAMDLASNGMRDWTIDDWDLNQDPSRGGYIAAEEE